MFPKYNVKKCFPKSNLANYVLEDNHSIVISIQKIIYKKIVYLNSISKEFLVYNQV